MLNVCTYIARDANCSWEMNMRGKIEGKGWGKESRGREVYERETSSSILQTLMYADWASAKAAISNRISLFIYLSILVPFASSSFSRVWRSKSIRKNQKYWCLRFHYSFPFSPAEDCNLRTRSPLVSFYVKKKEKKRRRKQKKEHDQYGFLSAVSSNKDRFSFGLFRNNGSPRDGLYFGETFALLNMHSDK